MLCRNFTYAPFWDYEKLTELRHHLICHTMMQLHVSTLTEQCCKRDKNLHARELHADAAP